MYEFMENSNVPEQIAELSANLLCRISQNAPDRLSLVWKDVIHLQNILVIRPDTVEKYPPLWLAGAIVANAKFDSSNQSESLELNLKDLLLACAMDTHEPFGHRLYSAKVLGKMSRRSQTQSWIPAVCDCLRSKIVGETDAQSRIVQCYCLGVLYRHSGFKRPDLAATVGLITHLIKIETNVSVRIWALRTLSLIVDGCGFVYVQFLKQTIELLVMLLLEHSSEDGIRIKQSILRVLASCLTIVGPEIGCPEWSEFRENTKFICSLITDGDNRDGIQEALFLYCQEQLHVFCPNEFNLQHIIQRLWLGLNSTNLIIRCKALQCLKQLCQKDARQVSEFIEKIDGGCLERTLFRLLDHERNDLVLADEIKDTILLSLSSISMSNLSRWIGLLSEVLTATAPRSANSVQNENARDEDESVLSSTTISKSSSAGWRSRQFAAECVIELLRNKRIVNEAEFAKKHLSDFVCVAFVATTSSTTIACYGLKIMIELVGLFGRVKDENGLVLAVHDAQIATALNQILEKSGPSKLHSLAYELSTKWISSSSSTKIRMLKTLEKHFDRIIRDERGQIDLIAKMWAKLYAEDPLTIGEHCSINRLARLWLGLLVSDKIKPSVENDAIYTRSSAIALCESQFSSNSTDKTKELSLLKPILGESISRNILDLSAQNLFHFLLGKSVLILENMNVNDESVIETAVDGLGKLLTPKQADFVDYDSCLQLITLSHRLAKRSPKSAVKTLATVLESAKSNQSLSQTQIESIAFLGLEPIGLLQKTDSKIVQLCLDLNSSSSRFVHQNKFEAKVVRLVLKTAAESFDSVESLAKLSKKAKLFLISQLLSTANAAKAISLAQTIPRLPSTIARSIVQSSAQQPELMPSLFKHKTLGPMVAAVLLDRIATNPEKSVGIANSFLESFIGDKSKREAARAFINFRLEASGFEKIDPANEQKAKSVKPTTDIRLNLSKFM